MCLWEDICEWALPLLPGRELLSSARPSTMMLCLTRGAERSEPATTEL